MIDWVRRWLLLAVVVAAAVVVAMTPSTTTASTAAFAYDIPSIARNNAHGIGADGAGPAQFSGWRAEPAPPSTHGRGTSTTPIPGVVATEAVRQGASFAQLYDGGGGVIAQVDDAGVLNLAIEAGPVTPRGGQMFNQALSEVGPVNGVRGTWKSSMPSNLDAFNASLRGRPSCP
jgi:hypothetical protein